MEQIGFWLKEIRWLDIVTILILLLNMLNSLIKGWVHGLISLVFTLAGIVVAARFAYLGQHYLGRYFGNPRLNNLLGFIIIFLLAVGLDSLVRRLSSKTIKNKGAGSPQERFWGAMLGIARGVLMAAFALVVAGAGLEQGSEITADSRISRYFQPLTSKIIRLVPPGSRRYFTRGFNPIARLQAISEETKETLEKDRQRIIELIDKHR